MWTYGLVFVFIELVSSLNQGDHWRCTNHYASPGPLVRRKESSDLAGEPAAFPAQDANRTRSPAVSGHQGQASGKEPLVKDENLANTRRREMFDD